MAKQAIKIQEGAVIDYTATATIANGDIVLIGSRCGVALDDAVSGDAISLALEGVYEVAAATADAIAVGDSLYWDATNSVVTTTDNSGANKSCGFATTAKAGGTPGNVNVKIG